MTQETKKIEDCKLPTYLKNALIKNNIDTVGKLRKTKTEDLIYMNGIWEGSLKYIKPILEKKTNRILTINSKGITLKDVD